MGAGSWEFDNGSSYRLELASNALPRPSSLEALVRQPIIHQVAYAVHRVLE